MPFWLFSCCVSVKGASRSIIYDLQRNFYEFIPNALHEIILNYEGKSIQEVKTAFGHHNEEIVDEYFRFLIEKEFIYITSDHTPPLSIPLFYDSPSAITNAIIEINSGSEHNYAMIFEQLDELICQAVEIRILCEPTVELIQTALFPTRIGRLRSIDLIIKYTSALSFIDLQDIFKVNPRISRICVHSAPERKVDMVDRFKMIPVYYSLNQIEPANRNGFIHEGSFVCSLPFFVEAKNHNVYFNRKVSITSDGEIKNCTALTQSFGNINLQSIKSSIETDDFQKLWHITKDQIKTCKDCEFRYMCTDSRLPILEEDGEYSHQSKCHYDPYDMKWNFHGSP